MVKNVKLFKEDHFHSSHRLKRSQSHDDLKKMPLNEGRQLPRGVNGPIFLTNTRRTLDDSMKSDSVDMTPQQSMLQILLSLQKDIRVMIEDDSSTNEKS